MVTNTSAAIAGDQKNIIILEEKRQETKKELECQKNLLKLKKVLSSLDGSHVLLSQPSITGASGGSNRIIIG